MKFSVSYKGDAYAIDLPDDTPVVRFGKQLAETFGLALPTVKLLIPGQKKMIGARDSNLTLSEVGVKQGSKVKVMASSAETLAEVQHAKELPGLPSFEHEAKVAAQRSAPPGSTASGRSSQYPFQRFEAWQFPGLKPGPAEALRLLKQLASDPSITGLMEKYHWRVPLLSEMPPQGKVGVSPVCVLGVNINKGQEISLRLRTDDLLGFRRYDRIKETLIHELAHMVHGDHDNAFKEFNSLLRREAEHMDWKGGRGAQALSGPAYNGPHVVQPPPLGVSPPPRDGHKVGGAPLPTDARSAAREAALKRAGVAPSQPIPAVAAPPQVFKKGDYVLYHQRDGSQVTAQVMAVDQSVMPPSYGIEINGNYRETEGDRLQALVEEGDIERPVEGLGHADAATEAKEREMRRLET